MARDPYGLRGDASLLDAWLPFQERGPAPFHDPGSQAACGRARVPTPHRARNSLGPRPRPRSVLKPRGSTEQRTGCRRHRRPRETGRSKRLRRFARSASEGGALTDSLVLEGVQEALDARSATVAWVVEGRTAQTADPALLLSAMPSCVPVTATLEPCLSLVR